VVTIKGDDSTSVPLRRFSHKRRQSIPGCTGSAPAKYNDRETGRNTFQVLRGLPELHTEHRHRPTSTPSTGNVISSLSCPVASTYNNGREWSGVGMERVASRPSLVVNQRAIFSRQHHLFRFPLKANGPVIRIGHVTAPMHRHEHCVPYSHFPQSEFVRPAKAEVFYRFRNGRQRVGSHQCSIARLECRRRDRRDAKRTRCGDRDPTNSPA